MAYEDKFIIWGPFEKSNGRKFVVLKNKKTNKRRTVSYPKWIMECHLQKELDPDLHTINHINRNFHDDDINNLEILPRAEHSKLDTRRVKLVELSCDMCGKKFERSPRVVRDKSRKGKRGLFCSRACSGKYARHLQLGRIEEFPVQPHIESEYYRLEKDRTKDAWQTAKGFLFKYASELPLNDLL